MKPPEIQISYGVEKSILQFTSDLCKMFADSIKGNYVYSSLSVHVAMTSIAYGAGDDAAARMCKALCIDDLDFEFAKDYRRVVNTLTINENTWNDKNLEEMYQIDIDEIEEDPNIPQEEKRTRLETLRTMFRYENEKNKRLQCIVTLANKLYISNTREIELQQSFEDTMRVFFHLKIDDLDFRSPDQSADVVNKWCFETTNGKINNISEPSIFADDSALVYVNPVHVKGNWAHRFLNATPRTFYLNFFNKIQVPTMYICGDMPYRYLGEINSQAVRLDFARSKIYMEIIIPNRINGLRRIKRMLYKMSPHRWRHTPLCLWLPKFEIETNIKFEDYLKRMKDAFDKDWANFEGICDKKLFIKTAIQKSRIQVDELGCDAVRDINVPLEKQKSFERLKNPLRNSIIEANRPFLFRIMHSSLSFPLLMGTVVNPNECSINNYA